MANTSYPQRLSNDEVMALPYDELVRYCDSLLTPDAAVDILVNAFAPPSDKPAKFARSHCPNGHNYTPENSYFHGGHRYCVECRRERARRFRERIAA